MKQSTKIILSLSIVVLITLFAYSNIYSGKFLWDDVEFIGDAPERVTNPSMDLFTQPSYHGLYRPLRDGLYSVTINLFGQNNPLPYHVTSMILHLSIVVLVFILAYLLTNNILVSSISTLLFSLHPLKIERISWIAGSFDLLGVLFLFLGLVIYVLFRKKDNKVLYWLSMFTFFVGMFTTEEVAVFIPLIVLIDCFLYDLKRWKDWKTYIPPIVIFSFYFLIRTLVLSGAVGRLEDYLYTGSFLGNIKILPYVLFKYLIGLFIPIPSSDNFLIVFPTITQTIISIIIIVSLISVAFWKYKSNRVLFFCVGWFFIALIPFMNLFPNFSLFGDRFFYTASFGFTLLIGNLSGWLISHKKKSLSIITIIILLGTSFYYVGLIKETTPNYLDRETYSLWWVHENPKSWIAWSELGKSYSRDNKYLLALNATAYSYELERQYMAISPDWLEEKLELRIWRLQKIVKGEAECFELNGEKICRDVISNNSN